MATALAEALNQPIRSTIHDLRLLIKSGRRGDISNDLQYLNDLVFPARCVTKDRNANIRAEGGCFPRSMDIDINPDFAEIEKFFPPTRQLAAHVGDSIVNDRRRVVPSGFVHTVHLGTDLPSTSNRQA